MNSSAGLPPWDNGYEEEEDVEEEDNRYKEEEEDVWEEDDRLLAEEVDRRLAQRKEDDWAEEYRARIRDLKEMREGT
jgi:hypothetical protein